MSNINQNFPSLVQRKNGSWLAISGKSDSLKIGVSAATEDAARARYAEVACEWKRLFSDQSERRGCTSADGFAGLGFKP